MIFRPWLIKKKKSMTNTNQPRVQNDNQPLFPASVAKTLAMAKIMKNVLAITKNYGEY